MSLGVETCLVGGSSDSFSSLGFPCGLNKAFVNKQPYVNAGQKALLKDSTRKGESATCLVRLSCTDFSCSVELNLGLRNARQML